MTKDIFEMEEEAAQRSVDLRKPFSPAAVMEKMGYFIAAVILLVVIVVMTTDIRAITVQNVKDLSLSMFVLIFCSYGMYVNMYKSGMIAGEKMEIYKDVCRSYDQIRVEIITQDTQKELSQFCRDYVRRELQDRIEEILMPASISLAEYEEYKHLSEEDLKEKRLSKMQLRRLKVANKIRPIKLTPEMLCKQGRIPIKRGAMHVAPHKRRKGDYITQFVSTVITSGAMGFIVFEVFANPSWSTVCAVTFKVLAVALTGYTGYTRGYDNIVTDTVLFTQDQIDILEQFKAYRSAIQDRSK